jgi:hypothetical protein
MEMSRDDDYLQPSHRLGVEFSLDAGPLAGRRLQGARIDDLVAGPPDPREILHHGRLVVVGPHGFPERHRLVHPAAVQVGADRSFQIVDERVHLLVRRRPLEAAGRILDKSVQRCDRGVHQLGHVVPRIHRPGSSHPCVQAATARGERTANSQLRDVP